MKFSKYKLEAVKIFTYDSIHESKSIRFNKISYCLILLKLPIVTTNSRTPETPSRLLWGKGFSQKAYCVSPAFG